MIFETKRSHPADRKPVRFFQNEKIATREITYADAKFEKSSKSDVATTIIFRISRKFTGSPIEITTKIKNTGTEIKTFPAVNVKTKI